MNFMNGKIRVVAEPQKGHEIPNWPQEALNVTKTFPLSKAYTHFLLSTQPIHGSYGIAH